MYQRVGKAAYKADLSNTLLLMEYLDNPENAFKSIHVAGTNGKGSVSHMMASVLQEAGYKVGLYTSPHLKDFRERIKINGKMISKRRVSTFVKQHKSFFEEHELSFFEMTVGLAFDYFRREKVDIAVIEVGLGGRLDSTNVITPEISVITNIGLDHTRFLGNTLPEIASEKAGIIKPGVPVIVGEVVPETRPVFLNIAEERKTKLLFVEEIGGRIDYELDLKGEYQERNLHLAVVTLKKLTEQGWKISEDNFEKGLSSVVANTGLMGRWQVLREAPKVICDTAHNKEGLSLVFKQLQEEEYQTLHMVIGTVDDKNLDRILRLFPTEARYYFCKPDVPRGLNAQTLTRKAGRYGMSGEIYGSVKSAYKAALRTANSGDLIFVGGSTFVVAEVL